MTKTETLKFLLSFILFFVVLLCYGCSNYPSGNRIEADFISNIYSKMDSVKSYEFDGYYSQNDVNIENYGYTIFRINDTLKINMKYKWYEELKEWGYEGWKTN